MGAAVVRQLEPLGAEIHVIDLKEPPIGVASFHSVDLKDPDATAAAVDAIGGSIQGLFNCAGLPGGRFSDLDTMLVNFVGQRHLADLVVDRMEPGGAIASISSGAGAGWQGNVEKWMPLVTTEGFAAGRANAETVLDFWQRGGHGSGTGRRPVSDPEELEATSGEAV